MTIFEEAAELITGPRREAYGPVRESFTEVATMWSVVFKCKVTPSQVIQAMIVYKLCREMNKAARDNRVDLAGYCGLLDQLEQKPIDPPPATS